MRQSELRQKLIDAMIEALRREQMPELEFCFVPPPENPDDRYPDPAIDKAMDVAYSSIVNSLKQVSRLAVRLGYLDKHKPIE